MASRNYRLELILRVGCICFTIYLLFFLLFKTSYSLTTAIVGLASAAQCVFLFLSVDRRNRVLARFLESIRDSDFSLSPAFPKGKSFAALKAEYALAIEALRERKLAQERTRRYIEVIADCAGVGFVVLDEGGRVDFANEALGTILGCGVPKDARALDGLGVGLLERFMSMKNGEKDSIRVDRGGERLHLLASARDFILLREKFRLITVQNIRPELEANEMDAWQELARVLMHEIMNSIAPISSLAFTATSLLRKVLDRDGAGRRDLAEEGRDAMSAVETIAKRSRSLLAFVENYRKVLKIPQPSLALVRCDELFGKVRALMESSLREKGISLKLSVVPTSLRLSADEGLIEQALINLVKNSIEALEGAQRPTIEIDGRLGPDGKAVIEVADNGRGIPIESMERIFIPFFTTKAEGSGVGLSLYRRIMSLHGGSIYPSSSPSGRTVFRLRF
jgi:two-component system, NtrC family, nitrogen regulation sensor histidine kinase NtrY